MNNLRIADMAANEKPVEKLMEYGAEFMSDAELLAIILRCGTKEMSAIQLAQLILNSHPVHKGLVGLNYMSVDELTDIKGVGKMKASQIAALAEISRRLASHAFKSEISLNDADSVASYFMERTRYLTTERVYALFMTSSNSVIREVLLTTGTVNSSLISPREIFIEALKCDAVSVVIIHNHPSGNPEPSVEDVAVSRNIKKYGDDLGIRLLDHIIIGDKRFVSLKALGML